MPRVRWVTYFHQVGNELIHPALLHADPQFEEVVGCCGGLVFPTVRNFDPGVLLCDIVPTPQNF